MAVKETRMCYILNLNMCIPFALHTKRHKVTSLRLKKSQDIQLTHLHFPICHGFSLIYKEKSLVMTYQNLLKYYLL